MPAAGRAVPNAVQSNAAPVTDPFYAPGPFRQGSDGTHVGVSTLLAKHPEYARLGYDGIVQMAATYRDPEAHALRDAMRDEGVADDWSPEPDVDDEHTHRWSDDA